MLVLTRKENEKIKITTKSGETVSIMLTQIKGKQVRIGVEAKDSEITRLDSNGNPQQYKAKMNVQ